MADEDKDQEAAEEASGGGMKKMIMLGGIAVVMLVAGIFAGPAIKNMISPPAEETEEEAAEPTADPPLYTSLHPPLVVNFKDSLGDSHFMQITIEAMSRDQNQINALRDHVAAVRNALILLYSGANYEEVTTREGKQKMLSDGLLEVQRVMTEITGEPSVEALYFTGLVIQ